MTTASAQPCALVIFGAGGDLAHRKLYPALYNLAKERLLPEGVFIIGVSRADKSADQYRAEVRAALERFSRTHPIDERLWAQLAPRISYVSGRFEDPATYAALRETLARIEARGETRGNRLFYLATPASVFETILVQLREAGLLRRDKPGAPGPWCRVVIEKPFGRDLASAVRLNRLATGLLEERQIFRVDHYLAKETVRNILVFRFGNGIFEPLWNRKYVDHVLITAAETLGVESRGRFYDETGVLTDVVQNHLLQILSLCAIEAPVSFDANDIHDRQEELLRSLRRLSPRDIARHVVPAQYRGYTAEPGVAPSSRTPTAVALELFVDNWRWQGVPFYLRAGKRLAETRTEVAIHFQPIPMCLFEPGECKELRPNVLTLRIQPDEAICLDVVTKAPGEEVSVENVTMAFSYAQRWGALVHEAYEQLLVDALQGDATLFTRGDVIEQAWQFVTPILEAWSKSREPLPIYEPGSEGPGLPD